MLGFKLGQGESYYVYCGSQKFGFLKGRASAQAKEMINPEESLKGSKIPGQMHHHSRMVEVPMTGHPEVKTLKAMAQTVVNSMKNRCSDPLSTIYLEIKYLSIQPSCRWRCWNKLHRGKAAVPRICRMGRGRGTQSAGPEALTGILQGICVPRLSELASLDLLCSYRRCHTMILVEVSPDPEKQKPTKSI